MIEPIIENLTPTDDCVIWPGSVDTRGYGHVHRRGRIIRAHRAAYEIAVGPITEGLYVLHRCDNRRCINPAHLFVGTHAENMADMVAKGRANRPVGEENGRSVLTLSEVERIRNDPRGTRTIAKDYAVSRSAIQRIKTGRAWAGV